MVLRAIPVAAQTPTRRQSFRRRKTSMAALAQYRAERVVAAQAISARDCWDGGSRCCYTERCAKQNRG
jgi:hypothetical protein